MERGGEEIENMGGGGGDDKGEMRRSEERRDEEENVMKGGQEKYRRHIWRRRDRTETRFYVGIILLS